MRTAGPDPQIPRASSPPLIRRRKNESANSCVGEGFFRKLLERLQDLVEEEEDQLNILD
jgi:hypothetical protein